MANSNENTNNTNPSKLDFDENLKIIQSTIERKNSELKIFIPALLAIIVSVFSYFWATSFSEDNIYLISLILIYILLAFIFLLVAQRPKISYKRKTTHRKRKRIASFQPWDLESYINLSDDEFVNEYCKFIGLVCSENERMRLLFVKQQINEYRYKNTLMTVAFNIILWGSIVIIVAFVFTALFFHP